MRSSDGGFLSPCMFKSRSFVGTPACARCLEFRVHAASVLARMHPLNGRCFLVAKSAYTCDAVVW